VPVAAAIATLKILHANGGEIYTRLEALGQRFECGFAAIGGKCGIPLTLARQGSAFCIYFMDHAPVDWHDIAAHHDFGADVAMRRALVERGIFAFPLGTKQWSISTAHTEQMIDETVASVAQALAERISEPQFDVAGQVDPGHRDHAEQRR
jgi:glutamate-1-semialdehyde 2,1-aminomutase